MENLIRIDIGDWMINAGIVGICNILENAGDKVTKKANYITIDRSYLDNFEEKYFKYFIDTYRGTLSWNKIISYKGILDNFENSDFKNFTEESLENLNVYIKDTVKYYLKSNSYIAAYELIDNNIDILALERKLTTINLKKKENLEDKLPQIKETIKVIKEIIDYFSMEKSKKYLAGKNVIYTIIKNAWNGISFLNAQTKEKDMYVDYKNYFVNPAIDELEANKEKYKYHCFICNNEMKDLNNDLSFLNGIGFDVNRKPSHVWNFNNDVAICNFCKLVYSCIPAGISYGAGSGIFINANINAENLIKVNENIKESILRNSDGIKSLSYKSLISAIQKQEHDSFKYELADIQVIRYEDERYKFNILSRNSLKIIKNSKEQLDRLIKSGYIENKKFYSIYELVIERLLDNSNLITLIHRLVLYKLSNPDDCRYSVKNLIDMLRINYKYMKEIGYMQDIKNENDKDIVDLAKNCGYYLRLAYKAKGSEEKLSGIAYRLLNCLKTNNASMFMDTILNCYLYTKKTVPMELLGVLKDSDVFKHIGYAFVASLIGNPENDNKENGGKKDDK